MPHRRGLVAALLLALWVVAPATVLAEALHAAGHDDGHDAATARAGLATSHGHEHGSAVPEHEHDALRSALTEMPARVAAEGLRAEASTVPPAAARASWTGEPPPPTGSPPALFYSHCALLL